MIYELENENENTSINWLDFYDLIDEEGIKAFIGIDGEFKRHFCYIEPQEPLIIIRADMTSGIGYAITCDTAKITVLVSWERLEKYC